MKRKRRITYTIRVLPSSLVLVRYCLLSHVGVAMLLLAGVLLGGHSSFLVSIPVDPQKGDDTGVPRL